MVRATHLQRAIRDAQASRRALQIAVLLRERHADRHIGDGAADFFECDALVQRALESQQKSGLRPRFGQVSAPPGRSSTGSAPIVIGPGPT